MSRSSSACGSCRTGCRFPNPDRDSPRRSARQDASTSATSSSRTSARTGAAASVATCRAPAGPSRRPRCRRSSSAREGGVIPDPLGLGAIFRTNDGSNSPVADVSTLGARAAAPTAWCSTRASFASASACPPPRTSSSIAVDDPYHFASAQELSLLPQAAADDQPAVPDHRDVGRPRDLRRKRSLQHRRRGRSLLRVDPLRPRRPIERRDAGPRPGSESDHQRAARVHRRLRDGARHGAVLGREGQALCARPAPKGDRRRSSTSPSTTASTTTSATTAPAPFTTTVFDIYDEWTNKHGGGTDEARRAVARGQAIFNARTFTISGRRRSERQQSLQPAAAGLLPGNLHHLPRHAELGQPLDRRAAEHRPRGRVAPHPRHAALHAAAEVRDAGRRYQVVGPSCPAQTVTDPGARSSPGNSPISASSRDRSCAAWPRARPTSTTGRPPTWTRWSTSTTSASAPASWGGTRKISSRSSAPCRDSGPGSRPSAREPRLGQPADPQAGDAEQAPGEELRLRFLGEAVVQRPDASPAPSR